MASRKPESNSMVSFLRWDLAMLPDWSSTLELRVEAPASCLSLPSAWKVHNFITQRKLSLLGTNWNATRTALFPSKGRAPDDLSTLHSDLPPKCPTTYHWGWRCQHMNPWENHTISKPYQVPGLKLDYILSESQVSLRGRVQLPLGPTHGSWTMETVSHPIPSVVVKIERNNAERREVW